MLVLSLPPCPTHGARAHVIGVVEPNLIDHVHVAGKAKFYLWVFAEQLDKLHTVADDLCVRDARTLRCSVRMVHAQRGYGQNWNVPENDGRLFVRGEL